MRIVAVGLRVLLASLLAFSPMQWAEARSCDKAPAGTSASHASAHHAPEAYGGPGATPVKLVAPDASRCCCGNGYTCNASSPCTHAFATLNAYSVPAPVPPPDAFRAARFVSVYEFLTHPPTPPPISA